MTACAAPFDLTGKAAVVTGAASGLGIEFAEAGAHVACADLQDASATVARVEALGREAVAIECDVSSEASVEAMVAAVVERFGRLDNDDPDFVAAASAFTPMGHVAEAREIRGAASFLASDASSYMTGQMLVLDGGVLAK